MPRAGICLVVRRLRNLSYTPRAVCFVFGLCFLFHTAQWNLLFVPRLGVLLKRPVLEAVWSFVGWGIFQALYWNLSHLSVGG